MELEFEKSVIPCLRCDIRDVQEQEQTQEVRLPEGFPDIGRVLGAWGQCILRGKQWSTGGMACNGGVMAWVLYAPEDGSEPRTVEVWLPMQFKWSFRGDSQREGAIRTSWLLRSVDARTLSARKLMVRACASVLGEAMEPGEAEWYLPASVPEDVQLLRRTYPAMLPQEAGEKAFFVEEEIAPAEGGAMPRKIVYCHVQPRVTEQSVVGGKAVFRGELGVHLLCCCEDGALRGTEHTFGFSQFSDLERDYEGEPRLDVMMAVSALEPELQDGVVRLKCGLVGQYLVREEKMLELVEDAYSPSRSVTPQNRTLELPMVLDARRETLHPETPWSCGQMVDLAFCPAQPHIRRAGGLAEMEIGGTFQILCLDENGNLQGETMGCNCVWELPAGEDAAVQGELWPDGWPQANGGQLCADLTAQAVTVAGRGLNMVSGLEMGEQTRPDPARPSLILRRAGDGSLWELAKASGSTVEAIRTANGLTQEPEQGRLLLIPVS